MRVSETTRRKFVAATFAFCSTSITGCVEVSGECRRQVQDESSVSAGSSIEFLFDLNDRDRLYIESIRKGLVGSNPTLKIKNPSGQRLLVDSGSSHLEQMYTAEESGEYTVILENRATIVSGTWDTRIVSYRGYCGEVY